MEICFNKGFLDRRKEMIIEQIQLPQAVLNLILLNEVQQRL